MSTEPRTTIGTVSEEEELRQISAARRAWRSPRSSAPEREEAHRALERLLLIAPLTAPAREAGPRTRSPR